MSRELPDFLTKDMDRLLLADLYAAAEPLAPVTGDAVTNAKTAAAESRLVDA